MNVSLSRLDYSVVLTLSAIAFGGCTVSEAYEALAADGCPEFTLETFAARVQTAAHSKVVNPACGVKIVSVAA